MLDGLHFVKQIGQEIKRTLEAGDIACFGKLMHEHWLRKRQRSASITNPRIDELYELALTRGGATGGKLVGAGGGGFFLFHTPNRTLLRETMVAAGLNELEFDFEFKGSVVV
jgi:D-glycero-alpha-D-manno-heptose-7-phosphate kinase